MIVQYIVVRGDLKKTLGWTTGALIAQACHATAAVTHLYRDDPHMVQYLQDMNNMHKVVLEVSIVETRRRYAISLKNTSSTYVCWHWYWYICR